MIERDTYPDGSVAMAGPMLANSSRPAVTSETPPPPDSATPPEHEAPTPPPADASASPPASTSTGSTGQPSDAGGTTSAGSGSTSPAEPGSSVSTGASASAGGSTDQPHDGGHDSGNGSAGSTGSAGDSSLLQPVTDILGSVAGDTSSPTSGGHDSGLLSDIPVVSSLLGSGDGLLGDGNLLGNDNGLLGNVGDLLGGGLLGNGDGLTLAGNDGLLQPVLNAANTAVLDVHSVLEVAGHELGLPWTVHGLTNLGETIGLGQIGAPAEADGHTNLVTDVLNAPGDILSGDLTGTVSHLGADLSDAVHAATSLVDQVLLGSEIEQEAGSGVGHDDPTNPVDNLLQNLGHDLQGLPIVTVNGGNNADNGGLLGGTIGSLSNSSSGHLVDLDVGPPQPNGQAIDILAAPTSGDHHTVEVNAVDVGQNGPHLLDLGALTGGHGLDIPSLGGTGTDGLTGNLLGSLNLGNISGGNVASGNSVSAPVSAPVDVGGLLHDLIPVNGDHGILDAHGTHIL